SPAGAASRPGGGLEARILSPLLDYYRTGAEGEHARDAAFERSRADGLRVLIAMVPDAARSTNSNRFDEWIGTIQRACESEGFVLAATWDERNRPPAREQVFPILGPIFSGSQTSMEQALAGWTSRVAAAAAAAGAGAPVPRPPARFRIISGGASAMDVGGLKKG